ncbi:MAG TPA: helix-turn-helix domain-containing protein [Ktedonobacteraceae bacterium]|nr:helix-turn-helix domain-containing protein [Ktedonobacteraceae bacterium]
MSERDSSVPQEGHCRICGVHLSRYNEADLCWSCQESRRATVETAPKVPSHIPPLQAQSHRKALLTQSILDAVRRTESFSVSDVGVFLKGYRKAHGLTQRQLASILEFDQSYISKLENGQSLQKITTLKEIATRLAIPPHLLVGVTPEDFATRYSAELLEVAPAVIRLTRTVREAGRADEALNELWPVLIRLEAQAGYDQNNAPLLLTLAAGQTALGVILGDLLPEEDLFVTVRYLKKAMSIVEELGDDTLKAEVHRGYGNELRKHKQFSEAISHLERAHFLASNNLTRGLATVLLARAYGEMGNQDHFLKAIEQTFRLLDTVDFFTPTFNPLMIHEVHLRGHLNGGHGAKISAVLDNADTSDLAFHVAPQWRIISHLTRAEAMFHTRRVDEGLAEMQRALVGAETCKLPHQVQRAIRSLQLIEAYDPARHLLENAQALLSKLAHRPSQVYSIKEKQ